MEAHGHAQNFINISTLEKIPCMSLRCKLVLVQPREYKYGVLTNWSADKPRGHFSIKLVGSANETISKFILFISKKETQESKTKPKKVK